MICPGWNRVCIIEAYWKVGINIRLNNTTTIKDPVSNDVCDEASFRFTNKRIYIYHKFVTRLTEGVHFV